MHNSLSGTLFTSLLNVFTDLSTLNNNDMQRYETNLNRNRNSGNDRRDSSESFNRGSQFNTDHEDYDEDFDEDFEEDEHSHEQWDEDNRDQQWGHPFSGGYSNGFDEDDNEGFSTKSGRRGFGGRSTGNGGRRMSGMDNDGSAYGQGQSPYGGQQNIGSRSSGPGDRNTGSQWGTGGNARQWGSFGGPQGWGTGSADRRMTGRNMHTDFDRQDGNKMGDRNNPGRDKNANRFGNNRNKGIFNR